MSTCPFFNCACAFHPLRYHSLLQKTRPTCQEKSRSSQFQNTLELHDGTGALTAENLNKAGWSWDCISATNSNGRTIWIVDALALRSPYTCGIDGRWVTHRTTSEGTHACTSFEVTATLVAAVP